MLWYDVKWCKQTAIEKQAFVVSLVLCQCVTWHSGHVRLPKCKDSERSVGFVTRVATQVASPEVIAPYVVQGGWWSQVLKQKQQIRLMLVPLTCAGHHCKCWRYNVKKNKNKKKQQQLCNTKGKAMIRHICRGKQKIPCCWQWPRNHQKQTPHHNCWWSTAVPPEQQWPWPGLEQA